MPLSPHHSGIASSTRLYARTKLHQLSTHYIVTPLTIFMAWLGAHAHIAYGVLFLGGYFEALVGPSFFIPGEIFLLGGSILAGTHVLNIWLVILTLYTGAILGDTSSYWIGRLIGTSIFHDRKKFLNFKNYHKAKGILDKYGPSAIFFARFIGPFSKFAPVTAGIFEIPFKTFLLYNIPGVIIGCTEFILAGYFFGTRYGFVLWVMERYTILFVLAFVLIFFMGWYLKRKHARKHGV